MAEKDSLETLGDACKTAFAIGTVGAVLTVGAFVGFNKLEQSLLKTGREEMPLLLEKVCDDFGCSDEEKVKHLEIGMLGFKARNREDKILNRDGVVTEFQQKHAEWQLIRDLTENAAQVQVIEQEEKSEGR